MNKCSRSLSVSLNYVTRYRYVSICHPHVHLSKNSGRMGAMAVIAFSFSTVIANFFEFETQVGKRYTNHVHGKQVNIIFLEGSHFLFLPQREFSDTAEPGFVPLGPSNYSYYIALPTTLRRNPDYCKVNELGMTESQVLNIKVS